MGSGKAVAIAGGRESKVRGQGSEVVGSGRARGQKSEVRGREIAKGLRSEVREKGSSSGSSRKGKGRG